MAGIKRYRLATFECRGCALCRLMFWLYTALCSCFSKLAILFERKEGIMRICVKRHKAVKGEEKGGERSRTDKRGDEQIREEQQA